MKAITLLTILLTSIGLYDAQGQLDTKIDGIDIMAPPFAIKNRSDLSDFGKWTNFTHKDLKIAVYINDHSGGVSYYSVSAYVYNHLFEEWRRFLKLNTRNVNRVTARMNKENETVEIIADYNSLKKGLIIASCSLQAVSNDGANFISKPAKKK